MDNYILVTAEKFGYGPIITCLNVIKRLKDELYRQKLNIKLYFLGTSIAKEQAVLSNLFDKVIECKTYDYSELEKQQQIFKDAVAVLSSENQFGAIYAKRLGNKNVYFIDNLVWMWDKITSGLENIDGYFISETFNSKENFKKIGKEVKSPIFIGPLRDIDRTRYKSENSLMINFGGAESFMLDNEIVDKFYLKILKEILTPNVVKKFDTIYVCGGSGVINALVQTSPTFPNVKIETLSNKEYLEKLHICSHVIMSSGLGNFMESVGIAKSIMFIPPINYSQLLQLNEYKKLDLGFNLVNWDSYSFYNDVPNLLDEETGVEMVVENIKKYLLDNSNILSNRVNEFINSQNQNSYFGKRDIYTSKFSNNASEIVVNTILKGIKNENTK